MNRVRISMVNGDVHLTTGYASNVSEEINGARGKGELIALERIAIPTGQMFWIDPDQVSSVRDA